MRNAKTKKRGGGGTAKENTSHMFMLHVCTYVSMHINIYIYVFFTYLDMFI